MSRNNLKKWRSESGMPREKLAKKLDVSLASLSRIENGKQQPREDLIEQILVVFQKNRADFYADSAIASNVSSADEGAVKVPVVAYSQAVLFAGDELPDLLDEELKYILSNGDHSGMAFALEIKGDSMAPTFREGDKILIDPAVVPGPGDHVVASEKGGEVTFRKYRVVGKNESGKEIFELIPLNDDYAAVRSDVTAVEVIGTMIEHRTYRKR